ncbi:MAG: hypothetical protein J6J43_06470 [Oscillospiraceae bacterium]|nr:hypothetical protein [Oscillospiraceae bacterium]
MEWYISGFCREQNQTRTVMVEEDEGDWDVGCTFTRCAHSESCTICQKIKALQKENGV